MSASQLPRPPERLPPGFAWVLDVVLLLAVAVGVILREATPGYALLVAVVYARGSLMNWDRQGR